MQELEIQVRDLREENETMELLVRDLREENATKEDIIEKQNHEIECLKHLVKELSSK